MALKLFISSFLFVCFLSSVNSHGRLMEPPARASLWRFQEFQQFNPPIDYNDNELFCGGKDVQFEQNGGRCGECGDNWADPKPRKNENGGLFGKGIVTRNYTQGENITIEVELTANHMGHFEFKICPLVNDSDVEQQKCFDQYTLPILQASGSEFSTKLPISSDMYKIKTIVTLPANLTCDRCTLLWYYRAGNSWGECEDGSGALGCGYKQEQFRGCSDIAIFPSHV